MPVKIGQTLVKEHLKVNIKNRIKG
jgi:hypothetical protein